MDFLRGLYAQKKLFFAALNVGNRMQIEGRDPLVGAEIPSQRSDYPSTARRGGLRTSRTS